MPFIGKDWRAPGEMWVRVSHTAGWEQIKLRPIQLNTSVPPWAALPATVEDDELLQLDDVVVPLKRAVSARDMIVSTLVDNSGSGENSLSTSFTEEALISVTAGGGSAASSIEEGSPPPQSLGEAASSFDEQPDGGGGMGDDAEEECWKQPHCFVKLKNRTKEFIGCTSMSEAFLRLDLGRAVKDIRRFNYICKVVQILVNEKLHNLSATSRKTLFGIIQAIVLHSVETDVHISTARDILNTFSSGLDSPHVCGSPQLVSRQLDTCTSLFDMIANMPPSTLSEADPESITFLDLPREILREIMAKLPDHVSLLEMAKANETFQALVEQEQKQWKTLCAFHFTQQQIDKHQSSTMRWRELFFTLKKYYGLREIYADLIHICCHCKALFWKDLGHPCVSKDGAAPSVRVTPQQFVDMLLFL